MSAAPLWAGLCAGAAAAGAATLLRPSPAPRGRAERRARRRFVTTGALVAAGLATLAVAGPLAPAALLAAWPTVRRGRAVRARTAHARAARTAHPDALDLLVLAVRAGHLPAAAVRAIVARVPAPVQPAYEDVVRRLDRGERFADAIGALEAHLGAVARPLVDALAAADRYGLPLVPVLDRLGDEARAERRRACDAAARQLPVRLAAPLVLCTLPSFVLLALAPLVAGALSSLTR